MNEFEYFDRSVDLLERIHLYQESAEKRLQNIEDANTSLYFSFDEYTKTKSVSTTDKFDILIGKVDDFIDRLNQPTSFNYDSKMIQTLGTDVSGLGKALIGSVPYFSEVKPYIGLIAGVVNDFIENLARINAESDQLKKLDSITDIMGVDFYEFSKNTAKSIPYLKIIQPFTNSIGSSIGSIISGMNNGIAKIADKKEFDEKLDVLKKISSIDFKEFASNISSSILYLKVSEPFAPMIGKQTGKIISAIMDGIRDKVNKNEAEGAVAIISGFGRGILDFAKSIMLAAPMLTLAAPAIGVLRLMMPMIKGLVMNFSDEEFVMNIKTARSSLTDLSVGFIIFSGSLAISALAFNQIGADGMLSIAAGTLALFGLASVYTYIGRGNIAKDIKTASLAVGIMGLSMIAFSASITYASSLLKADPSSLLVMGGSIAIFGLIYSQLGLPEIASQIAWGSLAVAAMGLSMMVIAAPIRDLARVYAENPAAMISLPVGLGALGLVYAAAGVGSEFIIPGAVAVAAIGGSLWVVGKGFQAIAKANINKAQSDNFSYALTSIINGFGTGFRDLSAMEIATLPLKIPVIGAMGLALISLGAGIRLYQNAVGDGWSDVDSQNLSSTIIGVSSAFAAAGSTDKSLAVFGVSLTKSNIERGIDSTRNIGRTLESFSNGLKAWKNMSIPEPELKLIATNISTVLSIIPGAFAVVGMQEQESRSSIDIFGLKIRNPFERGAVSAGIKSTKDIGKTLESLQMGIKVWKDKTMEPEEANLIANNIKTVLDVIPTAFAAVGNAENKGKTGIQIGAFKIANPFEKGSVQKGIDITKNMSGVLIDFQKSIEIWMPGGKNAIDINAVNQMSGNITTMLVAIPKAFAEASKSNTNISSFKIVNDYLGKLSKHATPIEKLAKSMDKLTTSFKQQISLFDENQKPVKAYKSTIENLAYIVKTTNEEKENSINTILSSKKTQPVSETTTTGNAITTITTKEKSQQQNNEMQTLITKLLEMQALQIQTMEKMSKSIEGLKITLVSQGIKINNDLL